MFFLDVIASLPSPSLTPHATQLLLRHFELYETRMVYYNKAVSAPFWFAKVTPVTHSLTITILNHLAPPIQSYLPRATSKPRASS